MIKKFVLIEFFDGSAISRQKLKFWLVFKIADFLLFSAVNKALNKRAQDYNFCLEMAQSSKIQSKQTF